MNKFTPRQDTLSPEKRALLELRLKQKGIQTPRAQAIPRRREGTSLPLSFAQQRLWLLDQLEPGLPTYNIPIAVRLHGKLDVSALQWSLTELVRRQESLHTTFSMLDDRPIQVINAVSQFCLPLTDLSELAPEICDSVSQFLAEQEGMQAFDLEQGPLFRVNLLRLAPHDHVVLLTMHHIISDGWSRGVLVREIYTLYNAHVQGLPSPLFDLPIQYADFALWQRQRLQGELLESQLRYWTSQLQNLTPLDLPTDYPRSAVLSHRGAIHSRLLPYTLQAELKELSQNVGGTLFITLLAAFQVLLARYSGQTDIAVGTPIANRTHADTEQIIGFFVNTLVLRTHLTSDLTFQKLLEIVRETALEAYASQDIPFEKLVEALQPERDLSRAPFFQVMFVLQNAPRQLDDLYGLSVQQLNQEKITAKFDLILVVTETEHGLACSIEYATDLYMPETIERMLTHWQRLLECVVMVPETRLPALALLTEQEKQRLLVDWNATQVDFPAERSISDFIELQAELTPDAVAQVYADECLTYAALAVFAQRVAYQLQQLGVKAEEIVGVYLERSLELIVGILGILKAGGTYLPLDPTYPSERLAFMLQNSQARVLVTQSQVMRALPDYAGQCLYLPDAIFASHNQLRFGNTHSPEQGAYMIYTSGSTGRPKGTLISHRSVANFFSEMARRLDITSNDRIQAVASLSFDIATFELLLPLTVGACTHLTSREVAADGVALAEALEVSGASILQATPSTWRMLLSAGWSGRRALKMLCGGEALSSALAEQLYPKGAELWNMYGPTETTIYSVIGKLDPGEKRITIGHAVDNTQLYVLDRAAMLVPIGVTGELYIGGVGLARGYWGRPEVTAEKFLPDPWGGKVGARLYRTGDLVRWLENGKLEYLGRLDQQIKLRGYRIELGEIEAVLRHHPLVRDVVAVVREDIPGDRRLVAYVVFEQGDKPATYVSKLRPYMQEQLPEYMVPSLFVALEAFPLTPNGKLDRHRLPLPVFQREEDSIQEDRARTPIEEIMLELWAEVLGQSSPGVHDNFFALGGHSLLATQLTSRIRQTLQVDMPLRSLFEAPTVSELALCVERLLRSVQTGQVPPLHPVERQQPLPLSFAQQRLWFLDQLEPESVVYTMVSAVRFAGVLSLAALEQSFATMLQRHESLRTVFIWQGDTPFQEIVAEGNAFPLVIDLSGLSSRSDEALIAQLMRQEATFPFDLRYGPLVRLRLLRLSAEEHLLLLTMHHIISDGWSMGVLVRELTQLYNAYVQKQPSPLTKLPIQYADFAVWQRQWLQGEVLEAQMHYWVERLRDLAPLNLPTDHPRPVEQSYRGARQSVLLPLDLQTRLKTLSQREGVTLFMTLLAAFQVLLARYSGQADIAVGSPIANRTHAETEHIIGFFVNTLVLRTDLTGDPSFREVLRRVREIALGAYTHQDLPLEKLVEALQPERDLSRSPLFQVMLVLQNNVQTTPDIPGLTLSLLESGNTVAKYDLTLLVTDTKQGLGCVVEYSSDLFEAATMARLLEHWQTLLISIAMNVDQKISLLPLLTESERERTLLRYNATELAYPVDRCFHELFEAQVERTPEAIAVVSGDQCLTYAALNQLANQLAHYLCQQGVDREILVGIALERCVEMIVGIIAILKSGGAYLPLDPTYPIERQTYVLQNANAAILLTQSHLQNTLPAHKAMTICIDTDWQKIVQESKENLMRRVHVEELAYVIYTSGSTGQPKGVQVTHRGIQNLVVAQVHSFAVESSSHILQFASLSFDASVFEIAMALLVGAKLFLVTPDVLLPGPDLLQFIRERNITIVTLPPSALAALPMEELPLLQTIIVAGEAYSAELVRRWAQSKRFFNAYGPTETTIWASVEECFANQVKPNIGRPIFNTQLYLLDQFMQPVPIGIPGELYIGGLGVARGYLAYPELTAQRFVPHPFSQQAGARLYRTGDVARYLVEEKIEFLGRVDHQVKVRGYRIELGEIEAVLSQHPQLSASAVTVNITGSTDKRLVAYNVANGESVPSTDELRAYLHGKLPDYMVPSFFFLLEALPLMPNGKVDRQALAALNPTDKEPLIADVRPRSPIEELVADIWASVLGTQVIQLHADFFEVGGHSLLATQLISRLRVVVGVNLPLRTLFEVPTIAGLAERVEVLLGGGLAEQKPALKPQPRAGNPPLSFAQQRLWFLDQLVPESAAYNLASAVHFEGDLKLVALKKSLDTLQQRHESLRTTFTMQGEAPVQIITGESDNSFILVDLSMQSGEISTVQIRDLLQQEVASPFSLQHGPLIRIYLFRLELNKHLLLLTMHHIVSDGWSMSVMVREISILYNAYVQGQPSPLPILPIQYADFAIWQRECLQGDVLETQMRYWMRQLGGITSLALPTDRPRPATQTFLGAHYVFELSADLTDALVTLSHAEGVTLFMLLLTAFQTLLYRYTGQPDIAVGTDIANRTSVETEALIGFFVNLLVLRTDLSGSPSFSELLHRVHEVVLGAYTHQDTPFEMLVERLQSDHTSDRMPLTQVLFVMQNIPSRSIELTGLTAHPVDIEITSAKFDLALFMQEVSGGLHGGVIYNADLFNASTIATMMSRFEVLLWSIVRRPHTLINMLDFYSDAEKAQQAQQLGSARHKLRAARGKGFEQK